MAADVPVLACTQNNTQSRKRGHLPDASLERKLFSKASSKPPSPLNGTSPFLNQSLFSVAPVDPEPDKRVRITASKDVRDKVTC